MYHKWLTDKGGSGTLSTKGEFVIASGIFSLLFLLGSAFVYSKYCFSMAPLLSSAPARREGEGAISAAQTKARLTQSLCGQTVLVVALALTTVHVVLLSHKS